MKSNNDQPAEAVNALRKHQLLLKHFYSAFEAPAEVARALLRRPGYFYSGHYFSHTVRYEVARRSLDQEMQRSLGYQLFVMPNTGLEVHAASDRIRFWKASGDGEIPPTGESTGRLLFCNQGNPRCLR